MAGPTAPARVPFWASRTVRGAVYQAVLLACVVLFAWYLIGNTLDNLARQNIATGFGFLDREAAFGIGEHMISYTPSDTYLRAFVVGLLNTVKVSLIGIVLATALGIVTGLARLSSNWLVARIAGVYVETVRNVPLLLQLFFWYALITQALPSPRNALSPFAGVFLSNRGIEVPSPVWQAAHAWMLAALVVGIAAAAGLAKWAAVRRSRTGAPFPTGRVGAALVVGLPLAVFVGFGAPLRFDVPALQGFNFRGGATLSPEFAALLTGLTVYTATFIAEIVRGGILSVAKGQTEAGLALGLRGRLVMRLIVLPQALRVIIPPVTNQYLNLTKNSSLAIAIGYPDLVSIANTSINQTGQAIEGIAFIMAAYLAVSLGISLIMNWYNARIALVER
jgi:general L-amino acid transport system permease protein